MPVQEVSQLVETRLQSGSGCMIKGMTRAQSKFVLSNYYNIIAHVNHTNYLISPLMFEGFLSVSVTVLS